VNKAKRYPNRKISFEQVQDIRHKRNILMYSYEKIQEEYNWISLDYLQKICQNLVRVFE